MLLQCGLNFLSSRLRLGLLDEDHTPPIEALQWTYTGGLRSCQAWAKTARLDLLTLEPDYDITEPVT